MVKEGILFVALLLRLNVLSVKVPALRERKEDIVLLAEYFLQGVNHRYLFQQRLSSEAVQLLLRYDCIIEEASFIKRENVLHTLVQCNGNKSKAAKMLHISRPHLYKLLKEYQKA